MSFFITGDLDRIFRSLYRLPTQDDYNNTSHRLYFQIISRGLCYIVLTGIKFDMEKLEKQQLLEISRITSQVEDILQNKLGNIVGAVRKFRGRVSTSPLKTSLDLGPDDFYGVCDSFSEDIQSQSDKITFDKNLSADPDTNAHIYLVTRIPGDVEIIVDASIGQFLEGHSHTFVGTRSQLRDLYLNQTGEGKPYQIVNTRSRNNPKEAFRRIYGDKGMVYGKGRLESD